MPPGDGIRLALGTKEIMSETLEPLSEGKYPNLEANKGHFRFTEVEADTRCPVSFPLFASNSSSETQRRYHSHQSRDLSNRHSQYESHVLSAQRNRLKYTSYS